MISKPRIKSTLLLALSMGLILSCFSLGDAPQPNILVIMVDDLGYSDLGCYGGEIQTPNLDSLAGNGVRFTQFYNMSRCSPSRASVMTGQYPHAVGMGSNGGSLARSGITFAEALGGANGYNTAMVGKWHLSALPSDPPDCSGRLEWLNHQCGLNSVFAADINTYPANRGFDRHYGIIWGVANYFDPFSLVDGTTNVQNAPADWSASHDGQQYYITDDLTEKAVQYINDLAPQTNPFVMYLQYTAPHWPLHARPEDIAKYAGVYDVGYEAIRSARYQRQINELNLFDPATTPLPASQYTNWNALSANDKALQAAKMATHAAMVDRVDQGIGQIVATLMDNEILDDTLILFFSDNGCSPEEYLSSGYDRPSETRDGTTIRYTGYTAAEVGSETTYPYLNYSWANVANTPMRYWKAQSFEGGTCTPFIVHWPNGITLQPGSIINDMGHVIDVMATCLDVSGVTYPDTYNGYTLNPVEGKSLVPLLTGQGRADYKELFFEHQGGKAARVEEWKISQLSGNNDWQLFNLATDRTETQNLETQYPEIFQAMLNKWNQWACRMGLSGVDCGPYENDAHYKFQDNLDDSLAFNDGAYLSDTTAAPTYAAGYDGQAIVFDGTEAGGAVQVANEIASDFTIAFWIQTTDAAAGDPKFFFGKGLVNGEVPGPVDKFGLSLTDGGKVYFGMAADSVPAEHINSQITVNDGIWHHVAAVHDADVGDGSNGSVELYIDGIKKDEATGAVYYGVKDDSVDLLIGAIKDIDGSLFGYLDGMMDEIYLYQRVLSSAEILALANITDSTPPTPNPAAFDSLPAAIDAAAISMTAQAGSDAHPPIEYYFEETSGTLGGTDSGWQSETDYTDSGLQAATRYSYTVRMRDAAGNETDASSAAQAWTMGQPDLDLSGKVDLGDVAELSIGWMLNNCLATDLCGGLDIDLSDVVDTGDLEMVAIAWLTDTLQEPVILFSDSYDRANNTDIDADATGMSGELSPMTYAESFEGSGSSTSIQIVANQLNIAVGSGMSSMYMDHNFTDSAILDKGSFSVSMDVVSITAADDQSNRFGGFGVGNTLTEAQAAADSMDNPATAYRPAVHLAGTAVSDFYVDLALDQNLRLWSNGILLNTINVGAASGTISVDFVVTDFNSGSTVDAYVSFNGALRDTQSFTWDHTGANYLGISGRTAGAGVFLDNLEIKINP